MLSPSSSSSHIPVETDADKIILENANLRSLLQNAENRITILEQTLAEGSHCQLTHTNFSDNTVDEKGPLSIVVLGASGDLAKKKTFPSLFSLYREGLLPAHTRIFGFARHAMDNNKFREHICQFIKVDDDEAKAKLEEFKELNIYVNTTSYSAIPSFKQLNEELLKAEEKVQGGANRLFYLALPPTAFVDAATGIQKACQSKTGWTRIIVEKPFGNDLASSDKLSKDLSELFKEEQIFRIDHYLGKEMVQNLMVLRFANIVWEPLWNNHYISNIKITFKEDFGCEGRAGYFDTFGIIRDIMQNHLMQILSLVAMESPVSLASEDVRDEKVKVLRSIPPLTLKDVVLGQYVSDGKRPGYHDDKEVPKNSPTPTFAQAVLFINNPRWAGVPFILKCAKAVDERKAEIRIQFKNTPTALFPNAVRDELVIRVQPSEAVYMKIMNKIPGLRSNLAISDLDLTYHDKFSGKYNPDAYERLILEAIKGNHNLFVRDDELSAAWRIFTPLLHRIDSTEDPVKPYEYVYGSRGPIQAEEQVAHHGWRRSQL